MACGRFGRRHRGVRSHLSAFPGRVRVRHRCSRSTGLGCPRYCGCPQPVESRGERATDEHVVGSGGRAFTRVGGDLGSVGSVPAAISRQGRLRAPIRARTPWGWIVGAVLFVLVAPWLLMLLTGALPHPRRPDLPAIVDRVTPIFSTTGGLTRVEQSSTEPCMWPCPAEALSADLCRGVPRR